MKGRSLFVDIERKRHRKSKRRNKRSIKKRETRKSLRNGSNKKKKKKKKLKGGGTYGDVKVDGYIHQMNMSKPIEIDSSTILLNNIPGFATMDMQLYKVRDDNGDYTLKLSNMEDSR